jgi:hypothetical protein
MPASQNGMPGSAGRLRATGTRITPRHDIKRRTKVGADITNRGAQSTAEKISRFNRLLLERPVAL